MRCISSLAMFLVLYIYILKAKGTRPNTNLSGKVSHSQHLFSFLFTWICLILQSAISFFVYRYMLLLYSLHHSVCVFNFVTTLHSNIKFASQAILARMHVVSVKGCECNGLTIFCAVTTRKTIFWHGPNHMWNLALVWAVSQHTDTSKNTKATLKCCHALHSYVGAIFSCGKLLAQQYPPSTNANKPSEDGMWLLMWQGNNKKLKWRTQSSHTL